MVMSTGGVGLREPCETGEREPCCNLFLHGGGVEGGDGVAVGTSKMWYTTLSFFMCIFSITSRTSSLVVTWKQFLPLTSTERGLAPSRTSVSMVVLLALCTAICSGVARLKSLAFISHPPRASAITDSSTWSTEQS